MFIKLNMNCRIWRTSTVVSLLKSPDGVSTAEIGLEGFEVQHWIRPADEDEFIARRIAKLENELGGDMKAHMTEWNEKLKGEFIYKGSGSHYPS